MPHKNWTPSKEEFLKENYQTLKDRELAEILGLHKYIVQNRLRKLGLKRERHWSKDRIISEIIVLVNKGETLSAANVRKVYPQLYDAANKKIYFGNWRIAVETAGYNYAQYRLINGYTETSFFKEIRSIHESGCILLRRKVVKIVPRLVFYAEKHYRSWNTALKKAGYTEEEINRWEQEESNKKRNHSKDQVKEKILSYYHRGIPVNLANIAKIDPSLCRLARKVFGSWENVVEFTGLNYDEVVAMGKKALSDALKKWDKGKVIQELLRLHTHSIPLNASNLRANYGTVYAAALKNLGSLEKAIEACGLDYTQINLRSKEIKWTQKKIIETIKELHQQNTPLNCQYIKLHYPKLLAAASSPYHFMSWEKAIEAADCTYQDIKKKRDNYTIDEIQKIIKQLHTEGVDLSHSGLKGTKYAGMVNAASLMYNGWGNFLTSIGIDYSKVSKARKPWTKDEIVSTIRELIIKGCDVSFSGLKRTKYMGMVQTARRKDFWGSYGKAVESAGYDYSLIRKNRNTESERGLALQRVFEDVAKVLELPLEPQLKGFNFDGEICIPDFIDVTMGSWIDVKISSMSGGIENTVKKYLKHVGELWIYYLLGTERNWPDKRVHFKSIKDFFPKLKQIQREDLIEKFNEIAKSNADSIVFDTWAKKWDKKTVLSTIKERYEKGLPITSSHIQVEQRGLYKAAMRYYKNWPLFLKAAGIDYDEISKFEEWTPERVKTEILKMYHDKEDLSHTGIRNKYPRLLWAATRYFKSWRKSVEECGIDYKPFLRQEQWTKERVIIELKGLIAKGADLSYTGLYQSNPKLVVAAERHFGSFREALEFLGIDYSEIRRQKKGSRRLAENI